MPVEIAYAAHTESCTFMLDADGVCRWVVASGPQVPHKARQWEKSQQAATRCIGAQYVASIDPSVHGGLVEMPRVGIPMLFARHDSHSGRISLVRTGALVRFDTRGPHEDWDSGMRETPRSRAEAHPQPRAPSHPSYEEEPRTREEMYPPTLQGDDSYNRYVRGEQYDPWEDDDTTRIPAAQSSPPPDWVDDTETSRFEVAPSTLEQMRATSAWRHQTGSDAVPTPRGPRPGADPLRARPVNDTRYAQVGQRSTAAVARDWEGESQGYGAPRSTSIPPPPAMPRIPQLRTPSPRAMTPMPPPPRAPQRPQALPVPTPPPQARRPRIVTPLPSPPPGYRPLTAPPAPPRRYYGGSGSMSEGSWSDRPQSMRRAR